MRGAERLNASTLLDRNLEAGRADKSALLTADGTVTYGELASLTAAVASYLLDLDVEREQRVLMILDDSPAFPATFLAAMRIGAVPVPVNPMDRVDNYVYYLDDSYAKVLVIEASLLPGLEAELQSRAGLHVLVVDGDPGPHASFDAVIREHAAARSGELPPPADTHREDMAFWLYSSGSTGRPKGVVHAHRDIGVTVEQYALRVLGIDEQDVCYSTTKLFHAYGLGNSLTFPLSVGASTGLVKGRSVPDRIFEAVTRYRPTLFFSVPALYAAMVKAPGGRRHRLLERARVRVGGRGAAGGGARALAGDQPACRSSTGSARPRCSTSTARTPCRIWPRDVGTTGAGIRAAAGRRARTRCLAGRGRRPDGPRRQLRRLLLAPA